MATLTNMNAAPAHVPVLAPELVELVDPQPGEAALDCTFGSGGHARLVAERLGPGGSLVCVDRDPEAEDRFGQLAGEVECEARFVRADFADAIDDLAAAGERFDVAYMDLGVSSPQLDQPSSGFSYAADASLDMRMDPGQELSAGTVVNEWPGERLADGYPGARRGAPRPFDRRRDRPPAPARDHLRPGRGGTRSGSAGL